VDQNPINFVDYKGTSIADYIPIVHIITMIIAKPRGTLYTDYMDSMVKKDECCEFGSDAESLCESRIDKQAQIFGAQLAIQGIFYYGVDWYLGYLGAKTKNYIILAVVFVDVTGGFIVTVAKELDIAAAAEKAKEELCDCSIYPN